MDVTANTLSPRRKFASGVVLLVLTLERLAYYALVSTFYLFLNKGPWNTSEGWDSLDALNAVFVLLGVSYISALLGGYVSDACLGRFRAIVLGMTLYILGYILLILITVDKLPRYICSDESSSNSTVTETTPSDSSLPHAPCKPAVYMAVVVLGTGVGMVKANIGPFGAEQLGPSNPHVTRSFFNWYYWSVNVGSLVGIGVLAFVEQDSPGLCTNGFFCGYCIAIGSLGLALFVLLSMMSVFDRKPAAGSSPLLNIVRITWEATRIKCKDIVAGTNAGPPPLVKPRFLDLAKVRYGGRFHETAVDDVRVVGSMMALFASLLPYWLVYFQMQTSFQAQGLHMRFMLNFDNTNNNTNLTTTDSEESFDEELADKWQFSVPTAWLTLFNQVFLIIALPVLTKFVYPYMDRRNIRLSMLARIGVGMFISSLAVFTAGGLETFRTVLWRTDNSTHIVQTVGNATFNAVDLSIFWQVPQYVLVAGAEALASIAGLEYAYSESPRAYQSLIMGLFYAMEGVGSFLGIALLQILAPFWLNNMTDYANINDNHLDFYLYFLGVLQTTTLVIYVVTIYVSRFSLELVPLRCDEGIGGPFDQRRNRRHRRSRRTGRGVAGYNRQIDDDNYEARLRRDVAPMSDANLMRSDPISDDDDDLINIDNRAATTANRLISLEESDDSVGVNETPSTAGSVNFAK